MTDRELLEDAAKAAGINIFAWTRDGNGVEVAIPIDADGYGRWQPLHENQMTDSDGDALRLAVRLKMEMSVDFDRVDVATSESISATEYLYELPSPTDPLAATRRAIVRAAAQIGRSMK